MKKYRLKQAAIKKSPIHYVSFRASKNESYVVVVLGTDRSVKKTLPTAQHGGPPREVVYEPATQQQMKILHEQKHPLIEEYDSVEPSRIVEKAPDVDTKTATVKK